MLKCPPHNDLWVVLGATGAPGSCHTQRTYSSEIFQKADGRVRSAPSQNSLGCAGLHGALDIAGIAQLMGSLKAEAAQQGAPVGVHTLSPGMVLTDLLLEGASDTNKQARSKHILNGCPLKRCWFALRS